MKIKQIFDEIATESSTKKKVEILSKYSDNKLLKRVLYLANSKRIKFYIKQIPEYKLLTNDYLSLEDAIDKLNLIINRSVTGNEALNFLQEILSNLSSEDAHIIERIIDKDCKIGMGTTFINKVFPNLIEKTPYMGAISFDEEKARKIFDDNEYAFSQIKMDGRYMNAIVRSGDVECESRQGEPTILNGALFIEELSTLTDGVYNGELTMGPTISRYESNGIIASLIDIIGKKNERTEKEHSNKVSNFVEKHKLTIDEALSMIVFTVWDMITIDEYFATKSDTPYDLRLNKLIDILGVDEISKFINIKLIETVIVYTYSAAMSHFQRMLSDGEEGTILKSPSGGWKNGKPNFQVKLKLEMHVDLVITGFNYGTSGTKNENLISSLNAESSDGLIKTRPQGITEDMMEYITENQENLLGKIIEVKCSGLSKDIDNNHSLLYPALSKIRDDKDTADSLVEVIKNEQMIKGLS